MSSTTGERLDGTVALVTGASSGIGAASAAALAAQGAAVSLVARRQDRLDEVATRIREQKGRVLIMNADVTDINQATKAIDGTIARFGRLDTLVNCAGVMYRGPVVGGLPSEWERMVAVNLLGLLYCIHAALPHLVRAAERNARGVSDIVNISSTAGRFAREDYAVYNATKHGVNGFSEALRQELAARRVRVSLVEPGAVRTELRTHGRPEVKPMARAVVDGMLLPEDVADLVTYIVTRPRHVAVNEILMRPAEQVA